MPHISNEDRREQFVKAASKVILTHGVGQATTRRIAEEAGAPLGSLHYCFRGKDELFEEVAKSFGEQGKSTFDDCVTAGMGVAAAAAAILTVFSRWDAATIKGGMTELEFYSIALRSKRHHSIPKKAYTNWLNLFNNLLKKAQRADEAEVDLDAIARLLLACQDGLILQDQFLGSGSLELLTNMFTTMICQAIDRGQMQLGR